MWQWAPSEYLYRNLLIVSLTALVLPYLPFTMECLQQSAGRLLAFRGLFTEPDLHDNRTD